MTKRILAMLLASLIFITSFPLQSRAAEETNYTVCLTSDYEQSVLSAGEIVEVQVMVSGRDDTVTAYHAYDLKLTYNAQRFTFVSAKAADDDAEITDTDGRIRVKGYGNAKDFSTAAVVLYFKASRPGLADVKLTHARIDSSDHAGLRDAPEAELGENNLQYRIEGYEVTTEGESVEIPIDVAVKGEDYTFRVKDYENYDYKLQVFIGDVDMTSKVIFDEDTGTYTIPGDEIDGSIFIRITDWHPKTYEVIFQGQDVTGEDKAVYNTDYTFTLKREKGFLYEIRVSIDGENYMEYSVSEDVYTIPGTAITGNIIIKVKKSVDDSNMVTVTFAGAGARDGSGEKKTERGVEYPFKVKWKKGYTYSIAIYVDGKKVPYEYDANLDTHYIPGEWVTGNIIIVIGKVPTVEAVEYVTLEKQCMYLILYNGNVAEGQVPKYDGRSMYWSDNYHAYAWLVVSDESEKRAKKTAEEKITITEGTPAGTVDYSGNVNKTLHVDLADAQLAWEMYEGMHTLDFMEMQKLLSADVYSDKKLNVRDVAAIVNRIS